MVIITDKCVGCGICVKNCPVNALKLVSVGEKKRKAEVDDRCIECGICVRVCPFSAIEKPQSQVPKQRCVHLVLCNAEFPKDGQVLTNVIQMKAAL